LDTKDHRELSERRAAADARLAGLCLHIHAHRLGNGGFDCRICGAKNVRLIDPSVCVRIATLLREVALLDRLIARSIT
jgi:hypothetical protein